MRRNQLLTLMFCVTLSAAAFGEAKSPDAAKEPSPAVVKLLGPATIDVLKDGAKVEVFRLRERRNDDNDAKVKTVGGYVATAEGKPQDKAFAQRIASVLLEEKTYDFDSAKLCEFEPGVGFRIYSGEKSVDVVLCFHCSELAVFSPRAADGSVRRAGEDFDNARAAMLKLSKEAFPDDKEIQSLE